MNTKWLLAAGLAMGISGCAKMQGKSTAPDSPHQSKSDLADSVVDATEVKVKLDQTPPVVQKTIEREIAGGELEDIAKQTRNGATVYEVDIFRKEGGKLEVRVGADGTVLSRIVEK